MDVWMGEYPSVACFFLDAMSLWHSTPKEQAGGKWWLQLLLCNIISFDFAAGLLYLLLQSSGTAASGVVLCV